jgi:hypothetical protein
LGVRGGRPSPDVGLKNDLGLVEDTGAILTAVLSAANSI